MLLLSLYCHILPGRGLEVRTLEVVHEAELTEPFVAAHFRNRNVALLHKEWQSYHSHVKIQDLSHPWKRHSGNRGVMLVPYTHCRISKTAFPAVLSTPSPLHQGFISSVAGYRQTPPQQKRPKKQALLPNKKLSFTMQYIKPKKNEKRSCLLRITRY